MREESTLRNHTTVFVLGEEFDETTADGRVVKGLFTIEDGKLVHRQWKIKVRSLSKNTFSQTTKMPSIPAQSKMEILSSLWSLVLSLPGVFSLVLKGNFLVNFCVK